MKKSSATPNCPSEEVLIEHLLQDPPGKNDELATHISCCEFCQGIRDDHKLIQKTIGEKFSPALVTGAPPPGVVDKILKSLPAPRSPGGTGAQGFPAPVLVGFLVGCTIVGIMLFSRLNVDSKTPSGNHKTPSAPTSPADEVKNASEPLLFLSETDRGEPIDGSKWVIVPAGKSGKIVFPSGRKIVIKSGGRFRIRNDIAELNEGIFEIWAPLNHDSIGIATPHVKIPTGKNHFVVKIDPKGTEIQSFLERVFAQVGGSSYVIEPSAKKRFDANIDGNKNSGSSSDYLPTPTSIEGKDPANPSQSLIDR